MQQSSATKQWGQATQHNAISAPPKQKHIDNSQGTQWPTTHSEELVWEAASLDKQTGHIQVCFWHVPLPQLSITTHCFWLAPLLKYKLHPIEDQGMAKSCFRVCGESMTQTCYAWTNPTFKQLENEHTRGILATWTPGQVQVNTARLTDGRVDIWMGGERRDRLRSRGRKSRYLGSRNIQERLSQRDTKDSVKQQYGGLTSHATHTHKVWILVTLKSLVWAMHAATRPDQRAGKHM